MMCAVSYTFYSHIQDHLSSCCEIDSVHSLLGVIFSYKLIYFFAEGEKVEAKMKRLEQNYAALQVVPVIEKLGTQEVSN